ncbi:hypothetical protein KAFR_0C03060 [Kazachstania africana CBS 2517]|uniref:Uncharacterized protein n=1 Tax=Kazachstania africana (strain ATCC 22294 / BCRC 22015 / CBS 2517 / CECT 1963 / NBRC 1671 / NRRL Y-8276) TaxID=1071382 RepID=H2ASE8_KAZAF|nr:hypothetical protein KAFR_0C03060 [Kazachstania africana CBS 2517]CCF57298.1 hypothetical protein KAFR_0C03060 [Kazachstania africana CBS 2517]
MHLKSQLQELLHLNIAELLTVQHDVTMLLEEKINNLKLSCLEREDCRHGERKGSHTIEIGPFLKSDRINDRIRGDKDSICSDSEMEADSEDFILTQLDSADPTSQSPLKIGCGADNVTTGFSSPLKSIVDNNDERGRNKTYGEARPNTVSDITDKDSIRHNLSHSKKRACMDAGVDRSDGTQCKKLKPINLNGKKALRTDQENKPLKSKTCDFNTNPWTSKPWILEDFKPNEAYTTYRKNTMKIEGFYSKVGSPNEWHNNNRNVKDMENGNYFNEEFENLRQRSKSPPGFGRLDFPSTQERADDKERSRQILYEKTRHRFLAAVNKDLPLEKREYIFKKDDLNKMVDDDILAWCNEDLQIFVRR